MGNFSFPEKLRFFYTASSSWPILVADNEKGSYFSVHGEVYNSPEYCYGIDYLKDRNRLSEKTETSLNGVLSLIRKNTLPKFYRDNKKRFLSYIGLPDPEVKITPEIEEKIVNYLKKSNAFNEDSALKVKDNEIEVCEVLAEKKAIGKYGDRFFVSSSLTQGVLNINI